MNSILQSLGSLFNQSKTALDADGSFWILSASGRYVAWLLAFVIVAPLAFFLWRRKIYTRYAMGAFFASFLIPLLVVPGIACESIRVSPTELTVRTGFWFSPTVRNFPLEGITQIEEREVAVRQRMMDRTDLRWIFTWSDGHKKTLALGDLFSENRESVVDCLEKKGVKFVREK